MLEAVVSDAMHRLLQGAGGGGGGGGGGSYDDYSGSSSGTGGNMSVGAAVGIMSGFVVIIIGYLYCVHYYYKSELQRLRDEHGQWFASKKAQARATDLESQTASIASGLYQGCYSQYGKLHDVLSFELKISESKVIGWGKDDVGTYNLSGDLAGKWVALEKTYCKGTGDRNENKGHTVFMQLEYCAIPTSPENLEAQKARNCGASYWFIGSWIIKTRKYSGSGKTYFWQDNIGNEKMPIACPAVPIEATAIHHNEADRKSVV